MALTMKIKEASKFLGISEYMIRKLCKQNKIPFLKTEGIYLFRETALLEWIEQQECMNQQDKAQEVKEYGKLRRIKE